MGNLVCLDIQLTSIDVGFHGSEVEESTHTAGEISHNIGAIQSKAIHNELADSMGSEKLSVFDFLLCTGIFGVAAEIRILKTMQSTVAGVCIVDIFGGNPGGFRQVIVDQIQNFVVKRLAINLRNRLM